MVGRFSPSHVEFYLFIFFKFFQSSFLKFLQVFLYFILFFKFFTILPPESKFGGSMVAGLQLIVIVGCNDQSFPEFGSGGSMVKNKFFPTFYFFIFLSNVYESLHDVTTCYVRQACG